MDSLPLTICGAMLETASYEMTWRRVAVGHGDLAGAPFLFGAPAQFARLSALLGVVFFLIAAPVENGGQLFNLNPALIGWFRWWSEFVVAVSRTT